jgi:hypothetical protein
MMQTENKAVVWIDIRRNNAITNDPCALCGARCDPCGIDFFLRESEALVCVPCALKHAPELIETLQVAAANARNSRDLDCPICGTDGSCQECGACGGSSYYVAPGMSICRTCGVTQRDAVPSAKATEDEKARESALEVLARKYGERFERTENGGYRFIKYRPPLCYSFKTLEEAESNAASWYLGAAMLPPREAGEVTEMADSDLPF